MVRSNSPESAARLPAPAEYAVLGGPLGALVLRPWFDRLALRGIVRWYFPLSRAWAVALESGGSVERFLAAAYPEGRPGAGAHAAAARLLAVVARRQAALAGAERDWQAAFFSPAAPPVAARVAAEQARHGAAHRLMAARAWATPLHLSRGLPPVRWALAGPAEVPESQAARLRRPGAAFPAPALAAPERSRAVPGAYGREYWLRFPSPVMADTAWARVSEPEAGPEVGPGPASLVFLHGIGLEPEYWRGLADPVSRLVRRGVRVIRPEGPWHGRRRPAGWYGGEPAVGRGPLGLIELFQAWVAEVALWIAWARRSGGAPVALGGVSLGALAAQLAAGAARHWPGEMRPDALLLVATTSALLDAAGRGSLARAIGLPGRMRAAGWSAAELARWAPLLEPAATPALPAARIVMVLGAADDLLPVAGGRGLARRWGVPAENLFVPAQGHFSVSLGLGRDPRPLDRLLALLGAG